MIEQLSFFKESLEERIDKRIKVIEDKFLKTNKALFSKNAELIKKCESLQYEIEVLKSALCRCGLDIKISGDSISFYTLNMIKPLKS